MDDCERFTTSFLQAILYGARGPQASSPDVYDFHLVNRRFMAALNMFAAAPVDIIPFLKHIPPQFSTWRKNAEEIQKLQSSFYARLVQKVRARLARGEGNDCFMEQAIHNAPEWGLENDAWLR
jgi:hypothetical protein